MAAAKKMGMGAAMKKVEASAADRKLWAEEKRMGAKR